MCDLCDSSLLLLLLLARALIWPVEWMMLRMLILALI